MDFPDALLTVRHLNVDIPTSAGLVHPVRDVSFTVEKGKTLGIVGESGSGKSLTALSLLGLLPAQAVRTADAVRLGDDNLLAMSEVELARRIRGIRVSMIFQEPMTSLNPVYTIGRQLTDVMILHRDASQEEATRRAIALLEMVGITAAESRLGQYPHQFSGGQRQRVMIALALMNEPELLIADEPTTALDVTIQAQILHLLADLQKELGMALILITHDLGVISRISDHVAVMYAGEIVETGRTEDLFAEPRHPYTRGLLDCIPEPGRIAPGTHLGSIPGMVPSLIDDIAGCAFAGRCTYAEDACKVSPIPVHELQAGRTYRCILDESRWQELLGRTSVVVPQRTAGSDLADAGEQRAPAISSVKDVHCRFPVRKGLFARKQWLGAVNGVSLQLEKGEVLALVGESGCGKSTLARILLGLQPVDSGMVYLNDQAITEIRPIDIAKRVQPIFQDPYSSLNPRKTVGQTIRRPLDVHDVGESAERERRVEEMMDLVGLPKNFTHRYPNQISGGQRQRVAVARAIIMNPDVVICDEPTSALDVSIQSQILNLLLDLRTQLGLTYLLITHDLSVVEHMATRVAVMYLGKIVELGEARRVFAEPKHPYTRALLDSSMTVLPRGGVPDNQLGQNYPNALDIPSGCSFHPRCPRAMAVCSSVIPAPTALNDGMVRCHLYGDEPATSQERAVASGI